MRIAKSLSVLAVSALTYAAVGVMPVAVVANPAAAASSVLCSASDLVNGVSRSAAVSGRGTDAREPDLGEVHEDLPATAKGKAGKNFRVTVPVYFHVVTDGATGAVTDDQIATQINVLDNTYAGGEGGATSGFSLPWPASPAPTTPTGSTPTPAARTSTP